MLHPRIVNLQPKYLVGHKISMSLADNKTIQLWSQFGPQIKTVTNRVNEDKISMQVYDSDYYRDFSPTREFEKWALVEVQDFESIPAGLQSYKLKGGLYAVFDYQGSSSDIAIYQWIFSSWIPNSIYMVDDRPHFEVLGKNYKNNDPNSEEEIWIPIKATT